MTDIAIASVGGGEYDLDLNANDTDLVIVGRTADTWTDELSQRVAFALGTWFAESRWDRSLGFPWIEGVFGRQPIDGIAALIVDKLLAVDGVDGFDEQPEITLDTDARVLTITAKVRGGEFVVPIELSIPGGAQ